MRFPVIDYRIVVDVVVVVVGRLGFVVTSPTQAMKRETSPWCTVCVLLSNYSLV